MNPFIDRHKPRCTFCLHGLKECNFSFHVFFYDLVWLLLRKLYLHGPRKHKCILWYRGLIWSLWVCFPCSPCHTAIYACKWILCVCWKIVFWIKLNPDCRMPAVVSSLTDSAACPSTTALHHNETLKWLSSLTILMQKSFWWWQSVALGFVSIFPTHPGISVLASTSLETLQMF